MASGAVLWAPHVFIHRENMDEIRKLSILKSNS